MVDVGLHFRAAQSYATRQGKVGSVPTFFSADYPVDPVFGLFLLGHEVAEFRDVPVSELENPPEQDFGARMRAAAKYATKTGFVGAFPTFYTTPPGPDQKHGVILLNAVGTEWRDVFATDLGEPSPADVGARFRASASYASGIGLATGFPNFFEGHSLDRLVYGTFFLRPGKVEFRDVRQSELEGATLDDPAGFMRAAQKYATAHGFVGAVPTFHTAMRGGFVCGTILIDGSAAEWRDLPRDTLRGVDGSDYPRAFRDAHDYATSQGFVAGFPTFFTAKHDGNEVAGIVMLRPEVATWVDVPAPELGNPAVDDVAERFRATQRHATSVGAVGGLPNFYHAGDGAGRVYGTILLRGPAATFQDVPADVLYDDSIVVGAIRQKWLESGGAAGHLGLPNTNELSCLDGDGRFSRFEGGDIYWTGPTGAHSVIGAIREHWLGLGAETSYYGYPVSDERDWVVPFEAPGRISDFERGSIGFRLGQVIDIPHREELSFSITTPDGTPLGGSIDMLLKSSGDYFFKFHMHASGATSYEFQINAFYRSPTGLALASGQVGGEVFGTFDAGSRDWDTTVSGNSAHIRDNWTDLRGGQLTGIKEYSSSGVLSPVLDIGSALLDVTAAAVGATGGVVFWLGSEIGDLLPSLGIGETFGVIAGVVVFASGAGLALAVVAGVAAGAVTNEMIKERALQQWEIDRLASVFTDQLDYGKLRVTNLAGLGGRAFTAKGLDGMTYLNLGADAAFDDPTGFKDDSHPEAGQLLVHETVHAWQIHHGFYPEVFCRGIRDQARFLAKDDVYAFGPAGPPWSKFNNEQQASIVDEWFQRAGGWTKTMGNLSAGATDPYFPYVHAYIRGNGA